MSQTQNQKHKSQHKYSTRYSQRVRDQKEAHHQRQTRIKEVNRGLRGSEEAPKKTKIVILKYRTRNETSSTTQTEMIQPNPGPSASSSSSTSTSPPGDEERTERREARPSIKKIYLHGKIRLVIDRDNNVIYSRSRDQQAGTNTVEVYYGGRLIALADLAQLRYIYQKAHVEFVPVDGHAYADVFWGDHRVAVQDLVTGLFICFVPGENGRLPRLKIF
ncbi:hypothetical protein UCREL1_3991 [Eutypa lata UCREL1]|uniref:Uncharacterized protein n=1 Tax=Eutypa lata (strain UCR-EL1) TaxID=1287681 RepID=M7TGC7_EUTLA|nr:hypothetical protein UCREL1_3991 [Eutypa lata UCREL1]